MSLAPGTRIGGYEVVGPIGAGGMGEVYRARDTRLHRDAAVKILPDGVAVDRERLARFEREAQVLASLDHPGIAHVYGLEDHGRSCALVMELVPGRTLTEVIAGAPRGLPIDDALSIARQIADAVETAHERGIVHRDLKPGNVMLTPDDRVKVLDFGLARVLETEPADQSHSPTVTAATHAGVILGTAGYMSPEQAKGKSADKRSDIWSFGCILFELITGARAFAGDTATETLANVLKSDPDWSRVPGDLPPAVRMCLRRCLVRDRQDRLSDISTVKFLLSEPDVFASASTVPAERVSSPGRERLMWALGALVLAAAAGGLAWRLKPAPAAALTTRFEYVLPEGQELGAGARRTTISPDGSRIVYVANNQLYVRALADDVARPIPGTADDPLYPVFSPDGTAIAYLVRGLARLRRISAEGGTPVTLAELPSPPSDLSWSHGQIVFASPAGEPGVYAVPETGGPPRRLVQLDGKTEGAAQPSLIDPRHVLFTLRQLNVAAAAGGNSLVVQPIDGGPRTTIVSDATSGRVLPNGQLAYVKAGSMHVAPFDLARRQITGSAVTLWPMGNSGAGYAVSRNGTIVYTANAASPARHLVWVDRKGNETALPAAPRGYFDVRISPDGKHIAMSADGDIHIWSIAAETLRKLTLAAGSFEYNPMWTSDSRFVLHDASDSGARRIVKRAADGTGGVAEVVPAPAGYPDSITPDGTYLAYHVQNNTTMLQPLIPRGPARPLLTVKHQLFNAEFSPDGKWIAYQSNESGPFEIYVHPFPAMDAGRWQISETGGAHPLWSRSGRELYFIDGKGMLTVVPVDTSAGFVPGKPAPLFRAGHYNVNVARNYDMVPDASRFLFVKPTNLGQQRQSFTVVTNWFDELKARMEGR